MWYLYLDESGDLGFDFVNKKPTKYFTVCILATSHRASYCGIRAAVKKTVKRKLRRMEREVGELKGNNTSIAVKRYFWELIKDLKFGIYAVTLNKEQLFEKLRREKARTYNFISRLVIDEIPFEKARTRVQLVIDKSKSKREILDFNKYIFRNLEGRIDPNAPINIDHSLSHQDTVLQAADMFTWGIFRKYERRDEEWYTLFKEKILMDSQFL